MARKPQSESLFDVFARFGRDLKMPQVDVDTILEHHRKNLEALEKTAKATAAGASTLLERQRAMLEDSLKEITQIAESYRTPGAPREMIAKQTEFARRSFETAVKNAGEVAHIVKKSGAESLDILRERIKEAVSEIRQSYDKKG